jgi:hypothetical protein
MSAPPLDRLNFPQGILKEAGCCTFVKKVNMGAAIIVIYLIGDFLGFEDKNGTIPALPFGRITLYGNFGNPEVYYPNV